MQDYLTIFSIELLGFYGTDKQNMKLNDCSPQASALPLIQFVSKISEDHTNVRGLRACGASDIEASTKFCSSESPRFLNPVSVTPINNLVDTGVVLFLPPFSFSFSAIISQQCQMRAPLRMRMRHV